MIRSEFTSSLYNIVSSKLIVNILPTLPFDLNVSCSLYLEWRLRQFEVRARFQDSPSNVIHRSTKVSEQRGHAFSAIASTKVRTVCVCVCVCGYH